MGVHHSNKGISRQKCVEKSKPGVFNEKNSTLSTCTYKYLPFLGSCDLQHSSLLDTGKLPLDTGKLRPQGVPADDVTFLLMTSLRRINQGQLLVAECVCNNTCMYSPSTSMLASTLLPFFHQITITTCHHADFATSSPIRLHSFAHCASTSA